MTLREALLRGRRRPRRFGAGSPTTYRGDGYEFIELRAYVPGDDVRRIDWAATARAGDLQTRVVLEDVALTLAAIVDSSPSMRVGRREPLLAAAREAAETWFHVAVAGDRCMHVGSGEISPYEPQFSAEFNLQAALRTAQAALAPGSALLVICDWHDAEENDTALLMQLGARYDCTALVARDPWYDDMPLRGIVRLRGAEGGAVRTFVGRRERERFLRAVRAREDAIVERLSNAGWRTGILREGRGKQSLFETFAVHTERAR
ncbi:MAG: DUF58 domain-containing protein [Candidatus Eremiobacteraeota bacterium]|nr:DUF58 domain-containing protein [Candidatus Eremiobacteraeota bacterium]